jgi:hypothetical protein
VSGLRLLLYKKVTGQTRIRDTEGCLAGPIARLVEFGWRLRLSELELVLGWFVEVSVTSLLQLMSDVLR